PATPFDLVQPVSLPRTAPAEGAPANRISGRLRSTAPTYGRLSLVTEAAQKKTPLYDEHVKRGAKMVPFAGWLMPVQYTGIVEEHQAVRNNVGIFDISHMGQFVISGSCAATWL